MKFDLEHDWQGNMSTPRKNLGEKTKLNLFFVLSLIFLFTGLIGHEPWRPLESTSISIILEIIQNNSDRSHVTTSISRSPFLMYI